MGEGTGNLVTTVIMLTFLVTVILRLAYTTVVMLISCVDFNFTLNKMKQLKV